MSIPKKLAKVIQKLYRQLLKLSRTLTKGVMTWLLRRLMVLRHRSGLAGAGFILPTVTMVILVVILLTTAIVFRSFDRAKNARNYRVDEAVMASAAPAIDRAKQKLDILFEDPRLPRATPSDDALYNLLKNDDDKFTFPDEQRLRLAYDITGGGITQEEKADFLEAGETISTAWRFPVDTDGDGEYDSLTLYSLVFRSPARDRDTGAFAVARSPLDARTPPMDDGFANPSCAGALSTSAKLVSQAGWYKSGSKLKKSFFVYTATVPIEKVGELGLETNDFEFQEQAPGTSGFSALEYQQDRARIPLSNNAVVFEDDLAVVAGSALQLNGRMITNGNLFTTTTKSGHIELYQVSAPESCFYDEENSKIAVGGHLVNAEPLAENYSSTRAVKVHLYDENRGGTKAPVEDLKNNQNQSTTHSSPREVLYNSQAFTRRVNNLVTTWIGNNDAGSEGYNNSDPVSVKDLVREEEQDKATAREKALFAYFKDRTRRVPFVEVPLGQEKDDALLDPVGAGDNLRPPDQWSYPYKPDDGTTHAGYSLVELKTAGDKVKPPATEPDTLEQDEQENYIGDRILVGNNLPLVVYDSDAGEVEEQAIEETVWDKDEIGADDTRVRFSQIQSLADVGDTERNGFWEKAAAEEPDNNLDPVGGLRIITGAGVYERKNSFLPPPRYDDPKTPEIEENLTYDDPTTSAIEEFPIVWPDTMPMSPAVGLKVYDNTNQEWDQTPLPPLGTDPNQVDLSDNNLYDPTTVRGSFTPLVTIDPSTRRYAKGDLRMRATAVYHYAQDIYEGDDTEQKPIACISSYYDPTNVTTARNPDGLPDVSGQLDLGNRKFGKSNNGVSYPPPTKTASNVPLLTPDGKGLLSGIDRTENYAAGRINEYLAYQANIVFPNGRFVNENLRNALKKGTDDRTLADQSAIDSTICALQILDGTLDTDESEIPHGAIAEVAFLDARQVQAIDADDRKTTTVESVANLTGNYDLSIEERHPLEVRATKIDLDQLRRQSIDFQGGINGPEPEYLLPNSGIIYASRDDALADLSTLLPDISTDRENQLTGDDVDNKTAAQRESAVDYKLDPTRRPTGILLYNGAELSRNDDDTFREEEKGLTLATNLPAYLWAWSDRNSNGIVDDQGKLAPVFNPHTKEEFDDINLNPDDWGDDFYKRSDLDENFACRPNDPRLPKCTTGDTWRQVAVIADSMTLLSKDFRFGFRNEGDYELVNSNVGNQSIINNRLRNGFYTNTYATNGLSSFNRDVFDWGLFSDTTYSNENANPPANSSSSYFNNFVTPVQRRIDDFPEYAMEICRKFPVSECQPSDWVIGYDVNGDGDLNDDEVTVSLDLNGDGDSSDTNIFERDVTIDQLGRVASSTSLDAATVANLGAGTTAQSALQASDQRYPRRVAFARTSNHNLVLDPTNRVAQAIGAGCPLDNSGNAPNGNGCIFPAVPNTADNALWFGTTNNITNPGGTRLHNRNNKPLYYETSWDSYGLLKPRDSNTPLDENEHSKYVRNKLFVPKISVDKAYTDAIPNLSDLNDGVKPVTAYTFCLAKGYKEIGRPASSPGSGCPVLNNLNTLRGQLVNLDPLAANDDAIVKPDGSLSPAGGTLTAQTTPQTNPDSPKSVNVFDLPATFDANAKITLKGTADAMFVLRVNSGNLTFGDGVELELQGVDPNQIFWVVKSGKLTFGKGVQLAGNFIGRSLAANNIEYEAAPDAPQIIGGRFLGFNKIDVTGGTDPFVPFPISAETEMTSQDQPLLVPVLNLHQPIAQQADWNGATVNAEVEKSQWLPPATETTANLIAAVGNTPPRPGEPDGGIASFIRFLEDWEGINLSISGSLMEFERSSLATGPFQPFLDNGTFFDKKRGIFDFPQKYATGNSEGKINYSLPPNRRFGYDVGLLSQIPDLFSSRFTTPPAGDPDEFFQEVQRDDPWIETLLCGTVIGNDKPAINERLRKQHGCSEPPYS